MAESGSKDKTLRELMAEFDGEEERVEESGPKELTQANDDLDQPPEEPDDRERSGQGQMDLEPQSTLGPGPGQAVRKDGDGPDLEDPFYDSRDRSTWFGGEDGEAPDEEPDEGPDPKGQDEDGSTSAEDPPRRPVETLAGRDGSGGRRDIVPPLPDWAQVDPDEGEGASPWLDRYVEFSRKWSPRAFDDFHAACGLWVLSTVAARRVFCHHGKAQYTNLYIVLVARTSLWAKSSTTNIGVSILHRAGLDWLLAPDDSTPQRFLADLSMGRDKDYSKHSAELRETLEKQDDFPAQRGWFFEEFGSKVNSIVQDTGVMTGFRWIIKVFDDTPEKKLSATISRGLDYVSMPYLALLANMTPSDLRRAGVKGNSLWADGFWARFGFVTPPFGSTPSRDMFPKGRRVIPSGLVDPLQAWHERLGLQPIQKLEIDDLKVTLGNRPGEIQLSDEFRGYMETYEEGLYEIQAGGMIDEGIAGNYNRFVDKALRISMLLASLDNEGRMERKHWVKAQTIVERWRAGLHHLYDRLHRSDQEDQAILRETSVKRQLQKHGPLTANEIQRYMWGLDSSDVIEIVEPLVERGAVDIVERTRVGTPKYSWAGYEDPKRREERGER